MTKLIKLLVSVPGDVTSACIKLLSVGMTSITMMHKCINKLVPDYLADMFRLRSQIHSRQTRSSGALDIPLCRLSTGQRSLAFRGAKLWNSLNDNIKS